VHAAGAPTIEKVVDDVIDYSDEMPIDFHNQSAAR